ncbi:MAG: AI-2E family transporter, partial [Bacteroidota bacterium]
MSRTRWIIVIASFAVLGLLIWYVGDLFIYLLIAGLIALMGRPLMDLLEAVKIRKMKIPSSVAAVTTMLLILGLLSSIFAFFIPRLIEQTRQLENLDPKAIEEGLAEPIAYVEEFVTKYELADLDRGQSIEEAFQERVIEIASSLNLSNIFSAIAGIT